MSVQELSFQKFGNGEEIIIAFHGFGQDSSLFAGWEDYFQTHTIYSIDLFFHGKSEWTAEKLALLPADWQNIFEAFLQKQKITTFSLLAFSLGGRVALTTLYYFAKNINAVWLIAPDGIKKNFWYLFATRLRTMRVLFRWSVEKPEIFDKFKSTFQKVGWVNISLAKLAERQMSDQTLRKRVYQTWLTYRYFLLRKKRISAILNTHQIPFYLFSARYDRLVPASDLEKFSHFVPHGQYYCLDCGHFKLPSEVLSFLKISNSLHIR